MDPFQTTPSRVEAVIAVITRGDQVLVCRRRKDAKHLPGYWEFPGGKREAGETVEQCLTRELDEELGIAIDVLEPLKAIEHDYPTVHVRLLPVLCRARDGEPRPIGCEEIRWIRPAELRGYRFPPANDQLINQVLFRFAGGPTR